MPKTDKPFGERSTLVEAAPPIGHNQPPLSEALPVTYQTMVDEAAAIAERANALPKPIASDADLAPVAAVVKDARELFKRADDTRKEEGAPHLAATRTINTFFATITERMENVTRALERRASFYQDEKARAARAAAEAEAKKIRDEEQRRRDLAAAEDARNRKTASAKQEAQAEELARQAEEKEAEARNASAADLTRTRHDDGSLTTAKTTFSAEIVDLDSMNLNQLRPHFTRADLEKALRGYVKLHRDSRPLAGVKITAAAKAVFR